MDRPRTRYARSGELAIAYQVHGSGPHDLLFNSGTASNIETVWQLPEAAQLFERLGRFARVIRYDRRDSGLSDPIRDDLTLEAHADDALAMLSAYAPRWATDPVRSDRLSRYFQTCASPRQAERLLRMSLTSDIGQALPLVQAPTLVLHPRDSRVTTADEARDFAELIPGAEFREIPGDSVLSFGLDGDLMADIVEEFVTGSGPAPVTNRVLATVLFTDLVDSTRHAASAGDRAWAETLQHHLNAARAVIGRHGGQTVKTTGDGVLALFTGPAQGVRCAQHIIDDARDLGLGLRSGLHTGEVERSSDDVAGLAVHLAARIMSNADAGEILVSRTVRDLVIGSELTFTDHGEHELKGIPDRWTLYAVA